MMFTVLRTAAEGDSTGGTSLLTNDELEEELTLERLIRKRGLSLMFAMAAGRMASSGGKMTPSGGERRRRKTGSNEGRISLR